VNAIIRFITFAVLMLSFSTMSAFAQTDSGANGLNLGPEDYSDTCVAGSQQVKVNVIGARFVMQRKMALKSCASIYPNQGFTIKSRRIPKWEEVAFYVGATGSEIDFILVDLKARKKDKDKR